MFKTNLRITFNNLQECIFFENFDESTSLWCDLFDESSLFWCELMIPIFEKVLKEDRKILTVAESKEVLSSIGIPINITLAVKNLEEAKNVIDSKKITFPIVMKILSPQIVHKTDVGGVVLNIDSVEKLEIEYHAMMVRVKEKRPEAIIDGVVLEEQVSGGTEVIIGTVNDPTFGPVLMFGLGGVFVEVLRDVSFRLIPLSQKDAETIITDIKAKKILEGVRGNPPVDKSALVDIILKVSKLVENNPEIAEIDLNPTLAMASGAKAVDGRIILK